MQGPFCKIGKCFSEYFQDGVITIPTELILMESPPPSADYVAKSDGTWVLADSLLSLDDLLVKKITELKAGCESACRSGWTSDALGSPHTYDTDKDRDQVTLTALSVAAMESMVQGNTDWTYDVTCTDGDGVKSMRTHTATQMAQIGHEVQIMIASYKATYYAKKTTLDAAYAAGDQAAMMAVTWDD